MSCCQCQGIESFFDDKVARRELKKYLRRGPNKSTRLLLDALMATPLQGRTLLDIGGGIGAIQHTLMAEGLSGGTNVDASPAYLHTARQEAERRGYAGQFTYHHGNYIDLAPQIDAADVVTLDRVICCFPDMEALVQTSASKAGRLYGVVFPRTHVLSRIGFRVANLGARLMGSDFRAFLHPTEAIHQQITNAGLKLTHYAQTLIWQVRVYERVAP